MQEAAESARHMPRVIMRGEENVCKDEKNEKIESGTGVGDFGGIDRQRPWCGQLPCLSFLQRPCRYRVRRGAPCL